MRKQGSERFKDTRASAGLAALGLDSDSEGESERAPPRPPTGSQQRSAGARTRSPAARGTRPLTTSPRRPRGVAQ